MTIRAVVFDMDGVLIDAREWHYEALNRALGLFGMEISRFDHLVTYDGLPTKVKLEMISRERQLPRSLHSFLNDLKQQYTHELIVQHCRPVFQHEYALSRLKLEGYRLGLASNAIRSTIQEMIERASLGHYFDVVLSNGDVVNAKPDPEIYLRAIDMLGLEPYEVLVVEDNEKGVKAASEAGAHVVQVSGPTDVTYERIKTEITRTVGVAA